MKNTRRNKKQKGGAASLGILLGRFQPFHLGHLSVVLKGLQEEDAFVVFIGQDGLNSSNPFTFEERKQFIVGSILEVRPDLVEKLHFQASPEAPSNNDWDAWHIAFYSLIKDTIQRFGANASTSRLYCFHKDLKTSSYLKKITEELRDTIGVRELEVGSGPIINATDIRLVLQKSMETRPTYGSLITELCGSLPRFVLHSILAKMYSLGK